MISNHNISQKITYRYLLAVTFIVFLSTSTYLTFVVLLEKNATTASIVNTSGKQRALSQRAALFSQQLVTPNLQKDIQKIKSQLLATVNEMKKGHLALIKGSLELNIPADHSTETHRMYFGDLQMNKRVNAYIMSIDSLLTAPIEKLTPDNPNYIYITKNFDPLLVDLNTIVNQYQKEGESRTSTIKYMELFFWIVTLLTLALEIQFIFKPMKKEVQAALLEREHHKKHLEKEVQEQTKKLSKANQRLNKLSNTDPLTGLKNRRGLEQKINQLHTKSLQGKEHYAVAILDLDKFKHINDTYGHDCGDIVLKDVAEALVYYLGETNIVSRYGGEEFLILLPNSDSDAAYDSIEKLKKNVSEMTIKHLENTIKVSFSAGITSTQDHKGIESGELLRLADTALYQAKNLGRNQVKIYCHTG
jgi:diguanylate cyclase (GGDEF)-like protein